MMGFQYLFVVVFTLSCGLSEIISSEEQVSFQLWKKEHGKVYQNQQEEAQRLKIFHNNLNHIQEQNNANKKSPNSCRLGLNKFADLTPQEFNKIYLMQDPNPIKLGNNENMKKKKKELDYSNNINAPASWDWRKKGVVTQVKYQGDCGSGWAFAATGAIESVNAIATGNLVTLSEQEILDCVNKSRGCDGGYHFHAYQWVIENGGINTEADYPYTAQDGTCKANTKTQGKVTIDGFENLILSANLTEAETEEALLRAVLKTPVAATMDGKDFHFYTSGIYDGGNCSSPYGLNHIVLIVGYDSLDGEDYWIVKNSFGQDWGMDGYIWIKRNTGNLAGVCAINFFASYPTKELQNSAPRTVSHGVKAYQRMDYSSL